MYRVYADNLLLYADSIENLKIFNPKLSLEVNKTGSFRFNIYPEHPYYSIIKKLSTIITVFQDNYLLFRGRVLNDEIGFHHEKDIECEGELAFLLDSIQRPYGYSGSITGFLSQLIASHNEQVEVSHQFALGNVTVTDPNNTIVRSSIEYSDTWSVINDKLIKMLGGYITVRHENNVNYIDYLSDFTLLSPQTIEFAKNLLDMKRIRKGEEIATALIPLGAKLEDSDERLTIKSVNNNLDYIYDEDAVEQYGWIFATNIWEDVTVASNLLLKGQAYLTTLVDSSETIELSAADLATIDSTITSFHIGTYVRVTSNPHGIDQNFLVSKQSIDLLNPTSNKLTLGGVVESFTEKQTHIEGIKGDPGKDGTNGVDGVDGRGITSTSVMYQAGTSGTTAPTGTWSTSIPSVNASQYLWTRTITTYTDNSSTTSYSVGMMGATGSKGATGTSATNIICGNESQTIVCTSGGLVDGTQTITIPFGGYIGTARTTCTVAYSTLPSGITLGSNTASTTSSNGSLVLNVASGGTLGSASTTTGAITLTFTCNSQTFTKMFSWSKSIKGATGATGAKGVNGKGIASTSIMYQASTSGTVVPTGTWTITPPSVAANQYLWTRTIITYTDSTTSTSYSIGKMGANGTNGTNGTDGKDAAIQSTTAPTDHSYMWLDLSVEPPLLKRWNADVSLWESINDTSAITDSIVILEHSMSSSISKNTSEILQTVSESYSLKSETNSLVSEVSTALSQTKDAFEMQFNEFSADLDSVIDGTNAEFNEIKKYIRFENGNIILGESGNIITLKIENDKITFLESGAEVAYFSNRKLYVLDGEFINSLKLGSFAFIPRTNGNLSFKKIT